MDTAYYYVDPEASGGLGPNTIMDRSTEYPLVSHLNYQFDDWLGDDLIEAFPCFVITEKLLEKFKLNALSGYTISDVEVSKSELFYDLKPDLELPKFVWLEILLQYLNQVS